MRVLMASIAAATILSSVFSPLALTAQNATITITMTGLHEISISLDRTEWAVGNVAFNTEYDTVPSTQWCTLTVQGTVNVNTFVVGTDAVWVTDPTYKWTLSADGTNGQHIYGLWFRISYDTTRDYVPITKTLGEFWPYSGGTGSSLSPGDYKKFGLRLLTPTYFYSGRQMQTQITISAVAA